MKFNKRLSCSWAYIIVVTTLLAGVTHVYADSEIFEYAGNGHRYQRIDSKERWHEAKLVCERLKGHLVTLTSEGENEFVFDNFVAPGYLPWLGGTDEGSQGNWRWVTGEPWTYTKWWPGDPGCPCGSVECETYLALADHRKNLWSSKQDEFRSFVCEWDDTQPERVVSFPQFGTGETLQFDLVLFNASQTLSANGEARFWDPNGLLLDPSSFLSGEVDFEIPPQGSRTLTSSGTGSLMTGSITVHSDLPVSGVVRFFLPDAGLAGVGSSEPAGAVILPVRREGKLSSGVAIRSTWPDTITVDLTLKDEEGQVVTNGTAVRHLPVNGRISEFLEQYFPDAETASFKGTMCVEARSGQVAVIGLELEVGGDNPKFTTLPVTRMSHLEFAPNLSARRPSGWSDRVVVSRATGTNTDGQDLTTQDTLYVDSAVVNIGNVGTTARFHTDLFVDGVLLNQDLSESPLGPDEWAHWEDRSIGSLSAGIHEITLRVDSLDEIHEGNEGDNEYTRFITVEAVSNGSFNGTWSGTTQQARPLSFEVEDGSVTLVTLDVEVQGTACTEPISGGVRVTPGAAITDSSFVWFHADPWGKSVTLSGTFSSSTEASGTLKATSQNCNGSVEITWSATRN